MLVPKVDQRPERKLEVASADPRALRTEFLKLPHSESAALSFLEKIGLWAAEWDSDVALRYYSTDAMKSESGDLLCGDFGYRYFSGRPVPISIEELWAEQEHWRELLLDPPQLRARFPVAPNESAPPSHKLWFATQTHFGNTLPVHLEWQKGSRQHAQAVVQPITGHELMIAAAWVDLVSGSQVQICQRPDCGTPFTYYRKTMYCPPDKITGVSACAHVMAQRDYKKREDAKKERAKKLSRRKNKKALR